MISRREFLSASAASSLAGLPVLAATPRPIRVVVPHPAGGAIDIVVRKITSIVTARQGQAFVIENIPGASGNIGTAVVARAQPDGQTLLAINTTFSYTRQLFKNLHWTPQQDPVPITSLIRTPEVIVVAGSSPYRTLQDLIDDAKARPGQLFYGTGGVGSPPHLGAEAFQQAAGIALTHVPYKGASEVIVGILSGAVQLMVSGVPSFTAHLRSGALRALGMASLDQRRSPAYPEVPTYTQAGVPGIDGRSSWTGIAAPAGTPAPVLANLQQLFTAAQQTPEYTDYLVAQASLPGGQTPQALAQALLVERKYWSQVAERAGLSAV